jgi:hypothetical protein
MFDIFYYQEQGCHTFLSAAFQNRKSIPNDHYVLTNWPNNTYISISGTSKIGQKCDFTYIGRYAKVPSGNPEFQEHMLAQNPSLVLEPTVPGRFAERRFAKQRFAKNPNAAFC